MSKFFSCSSCSGSGTLKCPDCVCQSCRETGATDVACAACRAGRVTCELCRGGGQALVKKGIFSDKYEVCGRCGGSRTLKCTSCGGKTPVRQTCSACSGRSRRSACQHCAGTGKHSCTTCKGAGKLIGEWFKSLQTMSTDQLKFEHGKRERQIASVQQENHLAQLKANQYTQQAEEMWRYAEPLYRQGAEAGSVADGSDLLGYARQLQNEIYNRNAKIEEIQSEVASIEEVLNAKWARP